MLTVKNPRKAGPPVLINWLHSFSPTKSMTYSLPGLGVGENNVKCGNRLQWALSATSSRRGT